jgi:hypothetical protein
MLLAMTLAAAATALQASAPTPSAPAPDINPFEGFFGEWTLKDDEFQQVWDGKTVQTQNIPDHRTRCDRINTDRSMLCVIDAGRDLKGHILWSYNGDSKQVHHLSHFGTARSGVGIGTIDPGGNLRLKVSFQDEPEGSYRIYEYHWVSRDEYQMMSRQYDRAGKLTGNWYGGSFVRNPARAAD